MRMHSATCWPSLSGEVVMWGMANRSSIRREIAGRVGLWPMRLEDWNP